jgi:hypothetical protein
MPMITHFNHKSSDNEIYCCLRNKIVALDSNQKEQFCSGCKMYDGDAGGKGVACIWEDLRNVNNPHIVHNPFVEFANNQIKQVRLGVPPFLSLSS